MMLEIFEILDKAVMFILPLALLGLVVWLIFNFRRKENYAASMKSLFCLFMTFTIIFSTMMVITVNIYQLGLIWQEVEVEPWIKEASFVIVEFLFQIIGVALIFLCWRFIY